MSIFEYQLGPNDKDPDDVRPPLSKGGAGADIDKGRSKTKTEKDLRKVQEQYDPAQDRFDPKK